MSAAAENTPQWARALLDIWFQQLGPPDWFKSSDKVDVLLRSQFEDELARQGKFPAAHFLGDAETARAAILLFDQVSRNIHRGTPLAFASDALALEIAKTVIAKAWDEGLSDDARQFVAMPLMHSESLADQDSSLAYFTKHLPDNVPFAREHRDAIARFGRFPHRNAILGRETTQAEAKAIADGMKW